MSSELTIIVVGIVQLLIGLVCGWFAGWHRGRLVGAQEILDLQLDIVLENSEMNYER